MAITNNQKAALHQAAKHAGCNDQEYRTVLRNTARCESAANPHFSQEGFVAAMAMFEHIANGSLPGCTPGYWQQRDQDYNPLEHLRWVAAQRAKRIGMSVSDLDTFVAGSHFTCGQFSCVNDLPAYWLNKLIVALDAIYSRQVGVT